MTGWNMPPGTNESMIPGNRPEDVYWEKFWKSKIPIEIYEEVFEEVYNDNIDLLDLYDSDNKYRNAIDNKIEEMQQPPEE